MYNCHGKGAGIKGTGVDVRQLTQVMPSFRLGRSQNLIRFANVWEEDLHGFFLPDHPAIDKSFP